MGCAPYIVKPSNETNECAKLYNPLLFLVKYNLHAYYASQSIIFSPTGTLSCNWTPEADLLGLVLQSLIPKKKKGGGDPNQLSHLSLQCIDPDSHPLYDPTL